MKYIFKISTLIVVLSISLISCSEKYLDVESKTESNTSNFYKTQNDAWRALIGCYDGWRQTSSAPGFGFYVASEVMGAECFGATGNTDGRGYQVVDRFDIAQSSSDLNLYETDWARYYQGIYRCNELIKYHIVIHRIVSTIDGRAPKFFHLQIGRDNHLTVFRQIAICIIIINMSG